MNRGYRVSGFGKRPRMAGDCAESLAALEAQSRSHQAWVAAGRPTPPVLCGSASRADGSRCELCVGHDGDHFASTDMSSVSRHWNDKAATMSRNNSGLLTGGVAGGARGESMRGTFAYQSMPSNQPNADSVAGRASELDALLRDAMQSVARDLLDRVSYDVRGESDSYFLQDVVRRRRAPSDVSVRRLLAVQSRADAHDRHLLSEAIRAVELHVSLADALCPFEASEAEQAINGPLDEVQLMAAREKCPTRWQQVKEYAIRQLAATRRLIDAITLHERTA